MKSAEEIYKKVVSEHDMISYTDAAIQAINEAREEVIKECAKIAYARPEKESILSLIKELQ